MLAPVTNYLAVIIAAVASMAIGAFWYSPAGFGKTWSRLMGFDDPAKLQAMKESSKKAYAVNFVFSLIMAYVLAQVVALSAAVTITGGIVVGFWVWLGFLLPLVVGSVLWEGKPVKLLQINAGYWLVTLVVMAAILAIWA